MSRRALQLSRLYAIIDAAFFSAEADPTRALLIYAANLLQGGVTLLQYRNKQGGARDQLLQARELCRISSGHAALVMNDRADLALAAGCDGVHVGQDDLSVEGVRRVVGQTLWVGLSTHNPEQLRAVSEADPDYVAVGPVFGTTSKQNPDPEVGLEGVRRARQLTAKPLVAIGGITRANCRAVIDAGADSVAVISDLLSDPRKSAEEFLRILR